MSTLQMAPPKPCRGQPAWEIATLFPPQGLWSEEDYLDLETNRLVEFTDGLVEVLPMPTTSHQMIVLYLCNALAAYARDQGAGMALLAPLRVRLREGAYREPDVLFMLAEHASRVGEEYWDGADLVMEVVSKKDRARDLVRKRRDYAAAGIPEYWIVDPQRSQITVLRLANGKYAVHGEFKRGTRATSALLKGFSVDVSAALAAK
jgi:Uma2 family endonuclease